MIEKDLVIYTKKKFIFQSATYSSFTIQIAATIPNISVQVLVEILLLALKQKIAMNSVLAFAFIIMASYPKEIFH
jgi:hypothetical protein